MYHTRPGQAGAPMGGYGGMQQQQGMGLGPGVQQHQEPDYTVKNDASEFEKENDFVQFFKYIQGHHSCTHSSMIGPSDHRIPRSGKFDVTKKDALEKLYAAVSFFHRQGKPLVLCEIATSRFRFFEDVDLLLPAELKDQLPQLQDQWVHHLLRHRGAVLGAVWRSEDPLGVKCRSETATVHVFSSSGWSSRHNQPKISLHFVWPDLICTPREAKGIRSATIEFLRESCSEELSTLLEKCYEKNPLQQDLVDMSPWEEIFDKAATEGTSLRLVFCDKGAKADLEKKMAARLEGRPKVPVGTYQVALSAGKVNECAATLQNAPSEKGDIQWLLDASIRLGDGGAEMPAVSNVWLSATQTKGLAGIKPQPVVAANGNGFGADAAGAYPVDENIQQLEREMPHGGDGFSQVKKELLGKKVDQNANWMTVEDYNPPQHDRMAVKLDANGGQIAELVIPPDVYQLPVDVQYNTMDGTNKQYVMHFQPGKDKYGTWFNKDEKEGDTWMWRKPAVPQLKEDGLAPMEWPTWAEFVLIEVAGHADTPQKTMGLAAIICAVSNVPTSGKVHGEAYWKGHMCFGPNDFGDDMEYAVNVPLATIAAVVFGLKAVLDLREKIGGQKIKGIFISSDHTVVEAAVDGQCNTAYLEPLAKLLTAYKQEILDDDHFPNCFNFAVSKIQASANKAAKLAREARQGATDEDYSGCSMGDIELADAVISSCESAAKSITMKNAPTPELESICIANLSK
ncbi:unnamed protein product [Amoebophrya sp. A120]|nr:unnamed protein product [Amoebophrya sp. A120]|eukprot:GSA120T00025442001.1